MKRSNKAYFISAWLALPVMLLVASLCSIPFVRTENVTAILVCTVAAEALTIVLLVPRDDFSDILSLRRPRRWWYVVVAGLAGVAAFFLLQVVSIICAYVGYSMSSSQTSQQITTSGGVAMFVIAPIVAPIMEEFLFRGVIFRGLDTRFPTWAAVVVSALLFSVVHCQGLSSFSDIALLVWIFVLGAVNAVAVKRTNCIWVPIALHVCYNSATVAATLLA